MPSAALSSNHLGRNRLASSRQQRLYAAPWMEYFVTSFERFREIGDGLSHL
jgi:hypothetical protein